MSAVFVNCQSCGGRTQINPRLPVEIQSCMLCGKRCAVGEDYFAIPTAEQVAQQSHVPEELAPGTCPHCFADVVVHPGRPLKSQRCHRCGQKLVKRRKIDQEKKADAPEAEAELFRRSKDRVWLPIAGITLAVVLGSIWVIWMMSRPESKTAEAAQPLPESDEQGLRRTVEEFSNARTAAEMLPHIRNGASFSEAVTRWCATYALRLPLRAVFRRIETARAAYGWQLRQVSVTLPDNTVEVWLLAKKDAGWRIEWRAFARFGEITLDDLLRQQPAEPKLVLSMVQLSDYYNGDYSDERKWQCLHVTDRLGGAGLHAYVPRDHPAMMEKIQHLPPSRRDGRDLAGTARRLALRLRLVPGDSAATRQAEVTAIEGDGWFIP
jgi:hypothetical protein